MPPSLLVIPVIVPEAVILIVPVFVKLASAVVIVPVVPLRFTIPALARVVIEQEGLAVPLILTIPVEVFVKLPVPLNRVPTVNVPLLVTVIPVIVVFGIDNVPLRACALLVKVYAPVPDVNVPLLFVTPPLILIASLIELSQVAPEFRVTSPVNVFVPAVEEKVNLPLVPAPILVVPVTVKLKPPWLKVTLSSITRLPEMVIVFAEVLIPLPESVRL